ncbi:60S ribosomal protein L31 [Marine Group I thaumarchaeote]|uniref:Large ribosomal subunit protein eL31 n=1 Tax=Marine Group I thaumarchaeote TaxID=2511932 RepID=A0A7K4MHX7_9ARCH|nr:60S ribosomal protein L31 [Marine Group I thaumarchaeote]
MSQELERVYTINLGKVKLSQSQHRAVRAINMIKEFARHHMKVEEIKIEEELAHQVWARGVRRPPRKIRVRMTKTDDGYILVSQYDEEAESKVSPEKDTKKVEDKVEEPSTEAKEVEDKVEEPSTEAKEVEDKVEEPSTEAPKKEKPSKEAPKKKS